MLLVSYYIEPMLQAETYTVLLTDGSYYISRGEAELVMNALRARAESISICPRLGEGPPTSVKIPLDKVLTLIAHDAKSNPRLEQWKRRRASNVVSLSSYVAKRGALGDSAPPPVPTL